MTARLPNTRLLQATMHHVTTHPDQWTSRTYRSTAGLSFLARACDLAGGTWVITNVGERCYGLDYLLPERGDTSTFVPDWLGLPVVGVHTRAQRILSVTPVQALDLSNPYNTLSDLRRLVTEICAGALVKDGAP